MTTDRPESGPSRVALGGFSAESKKIIRQLEDYGWTFRISKQGHAIGHAPDGETRTSISKNLSRANRSQQAAEATVKRWERHLEVQRLGKATEALLSDDQGYDPVIDAVIAAGVQKRVEALTEQGEPELLQATSATLAEQVQSLTDALTEERSKSASLQADVDAWLALAPRPS